MHPQSHSNADNNIPDEIAAKLIEQEHRLLQIIWNVFITWKESGSIRQAAARKALLWRILAPSNVVIGSVSLTAIFGIWLAWQANRLLSNQNALIETQTYLMESERRSGLVFELSSILDELDEEQDAWSAAGKKDADFRLSALLIARVVSLSRSLRPYRYLDAERYVEGKLEGKQILISRPLSPERGQLLVTLSSLGHVVLQQVIENGADFSCADLRHADLSKSNLDGANLQEADLSKADFTGTSLRFTDFTHANIGEANLAGSTFYATRLDGADLRGASLAGAAFHGCSVFAANFCNADLSNIDFKDPSPSGGSSVSWGNEKLARADLDGAIVGRESDNALKWMEEALEVSSTEGWELGGYEIKATKRFIDPEATDAWEEVWQLVARQTHRATTSSIR